VSLLSDFLDILCSGDAAGGLRAFDEAGRLTALIPELEAGRGFAQPELHHYTVLDHNLAAVEALETALRGDGAWALLRESTDWFEFDTALEGAIDGVPVQALTKLSCLVHDVGKPASAVQRDGRLRFPRHGPLGAELMAERLPGAGLGPKATAFVAANVRYHLRPGELVRNWPPSDRAVRRFAHDLGGHVLPLMLVNLSDGMATRGPHYTHDHYARHCNFLNYVVARVLHVTFEPGPPVITGEDLITELDMPSGRLLGAVLTSIRRAQEQGGVRDRESALALAREVLAASQQQGSAAVRSKGQE
jgi:hypothetical protein